MKFKSDVADNFYYERLIVNDFVYLYTKALSSDYRRALLRTYRYACNMSEPLMGITMELIEATNKDDNSFYNIIYEYDLTDNDKLYYYYFFNDIRRTYEI